MTNGATPSEAVATPPQRSPAHVVFVGIATFVVIRLIGAFFATNATGSVVLQALGAELGAGRAGVEWSPPNARPPVRRALIGAAFGLGFGALVIALAAAAGRGGVALAPSPSLATLLIGAAVSAAAAVRDELVFRGVLLKAFRDRLPYPALLAASAMTSIAASFPTTAGDALLSAAIGVAFAAVWMVERGAFIACAAHATAAFATGPLVSGGLFDLRVESATFNGPQGVASSLGGAALAAICAVAVAVWARRKI